MKKEQSEILKEIIKVSSLTQGKIYKKTKINLNAVFSGRKELSKEDINKLYKLLRIAPLFFKELEGEHKRD